MQGLNVLSLFDGMSSGMIALERAGIKVQNYYASEIDKHAIKVSKANYPNIIQLGDVQSIDVTSLPKIDLLIGGSPCQTLSSLGNGTGFDGKSGLFFEFVRLVKELQPKNFILENVKMKKEWEDVITFYMGVSPVELNSKYVSAQNRPRLFWTNIDVKPMEDKGVVLSDVIEKEAQEKYFLTDKAKIYITQKERLKKQLVNLNGNKENKAITLLARYTGLNGTFLCVDCNGRLDHEKAGTLTARYAKGVASFGGDSFVYDMEDITKERIRRFTPEECEKLQTVPIGYTSSVSDSQRYKMLGNGWTIDVIAHILRGLHESTEELENQELEMVY